MPSHLPPCKHDQSKAPSRPGELHPEPLTDPDVNLSIHPARATQRRLPPSIKTRSSSGYPLSPSQCGWPAPFAPRELPRFLTTTEQSAPDRCLGIFGLMVVSICAFSLAITDPVLKFRTQAWIRVMPSLRRTPHGQ